MTRRSVDDILSRARKASRVLARIDGSEVDRALGLVAEALRSSSRQILDANQADVEAAREEEGLLVDRLILTEERVESMAQGVEEVARQPDPVGEQVESWTLPNGLRVDRVRSPLGVVGVIYEARPNVTTDVVALCLRSRNAAVLRGSRQARNSNSAIVDAVRKALGDTSVPPDAVCLIDDTSREAALELMKAEGRLDLLVPRGGRQLIEAILEHARVPFIIDGDGNCHVYVDASADPEKASAIVLDAKVSRPSVCNAVETLLVHESMGRWLTGALDELSGAGVEIRADDEVRKLWPSASRATEVDWATEYLDLKLAVRMVRSVDEAIDHIETYGTRNAEAIVAEDEQVVRRFAEGVDSGSVFVNASTRFSDGGQFGMGAEIGISTQKLHARGPMGARDLTSVRYVVWGEGQVRG